MANVKGFGVKFSATGTTNQAKKRQTWQGMPSLNLETRIQMWQVGLLQLRLPAGVQPRSLITDETHWLDRASAAGYLNPEVNGQQSIFYTASPPDFRLEAADWYLHPDEYWDQAPVRLQEAIQQFPAALFTLSVSGQAPGFYPDRTPDYTEEQEAIMRSIFRETIRLGWSLPQYKWFVMQQFRKTTAIVTYKEAQQILLQLSKLMNSFENG